MADRGGGTPGEPQHLEVLFRSYQIDIRLNSAGQYAQTSTRSNFWPLQYPLRAPKPYTNCKASSQSPVFLRGFQGRPKTPASQLVSPAVRPKSFCLKSNTPSPNIAKPQSYTTSNYLKALSQTLDSKGRKPKSLPAVGRGR